MDIEETVYTAIATYVPWLGLCLLLSTTHVNKIELCVSRSNNISLEASAVYTYQATSCAHERRRYRDKMYDIKRFSCYFCMICITTHFYHGPDIL